MARSAGRVNVRTVSVDKKYGGSGPPDSSIITTFHPMRLLALVLALSIPVTASSAIDAQTTAGELTNSTPSMPAAARAASEYARARLDLDLAAIQTYRPSYPFWQHIFTIPDGRIAYGSAQDGRL